MNRSVLKPYLIFILFFVVGFGIYSNTLEVNFLFDDLPRITENPHIQITELSLKELAKAGVKSSPTRPFGFITFALNYYFHQFDLKGYHLVNIIIHILTATLLYFFIKTTLGIPLLSSRYNRPEIIAFIAAFIWLVHPLHTQSVTYIVQRLNSMAAMFYVLSLLFYAKGRLAEEKRKRRLWHIGSILAGIMALGSKQNAAMLPFFIILYEWYFFQDLNRDWAKRHLKYVFGAAALFCLIAFLYLGTNPIEELKTINDFAHHEFTLTERILTQFRVLIYYLSLLVYPNPSRLNLDYDFPLSHSLVDPLSTLLCFGLVVGILGLAVYLAKKERLLSFCILWFFGNLVIESSVIPLAIIYEHRTYMPSMFICLLAVMLGYRYIKIKWPGVALVCIVVMVFSFWTYQRNRIWSDPVTFWSDCVKKSPQKSRPHVNLGTVLENQDRIEEATDHYVKALKIKPDSVDAHYNLANALVKQGRIEEAMDHYFQTLRIQPNYVKAHNNLGIVLADQGRMEEAINHYLQALKIKPDFIDAHYNLANALIALQGVTDTAIGHFNEALRLNPEFVKAHNSLAAALIRTGKFDEAVVRLREAFRINPQIAATSLNLGIALMGQNKSDEAIAYFRNALKINPDMPEAHVNLGIISFNKGRLDEAVAHFRKALQIDSGNDEALSNLNKTLGILKKIDSDIKKAQKDLMFKPEDPVLNFQLGDMYRIKGDLDKAFAHYQKTISIKPDFPEALYHLAKLYISRREYDKAQFLYQKMIDLLPDNPAIYYNIGCLYAIQNKPEESVSWLKKAVKKGFNDWNQIKIDSDLDNIRGSSHYEAFVKGH